MNYKSIIFAKLIIICFICIIAIDYLNFDINVSNTNLILGNSLVPENVVINHIENNTNNNEDIFSSLIGDYKILQLSDDQRLIMINENKPQFFDETNIYLSSGVKVQYKDYLNFKSLFDENSIPEYESRSNIDISENILEMINLLNDNRSPLLDKLRLIELSEDNKLSIRFETCEVVVMDNVNTRNKKQILKKIKVLNAFIHQSKESLDKIENIDLRWDDRVFIKTI